MNFLPIISRYFHKFTGQIPLRLFYPLDEKATEKVEFPYYSN